MGSKALLSFFFIFSSFVHQGFSDGLDLLLPGLGFGSIEEAQCMQKLLPCEPYLKNTTNLPPACCAPLSQMVTNNTECLCSFFNSLQLLVSVNITKDDLLKLPNACGVAVDVPKCNTEASSSSPTTGININPADSTPADSTTSRSSTKMTTPYGITHFGVPGFVALFTSLVLPAY